jgi:hypothetical protein
VTRDVRLPYNITGERYLRILTDARQAVAEHNRDNNGRATEALLSIGAGPQPSLVIEQVTVESAPVAGQPLVVSARITNTGDAIPEDLSWTDAWTLSGSSEITSEAVRLASIPRQGPLASGASYSVRLEPEIPSYAHGRYYLITTTDVSNRVHRDAGQTGRIQRTLLDLVQLPPVDLVVENVQLPAEARPGETVSITYDLVNRGAHPARGLMYDAAYLSADGVLDTGDPRIGIVRRSIDLAPSQSMQVELAAMIPDRVATAPTDVRPLGFDLQDANLRLDGDVPGVVPGDYHAIVWTDIRNNIRETDPTNNRSVSAARTSVTIPRLTLDTAVRQVVLAGRQHFFQVDVEAGKDLRLRLSHAGGAVQEQEYEIYVAYGRTPSMSDFDAAFLANSGPRPEAFVPGTRAGTYYVMVRHPYLMSSQEPEIDLVAEAFDFALLGMTPDAGGNSGRVVATVRGAQLTGGTRFFLERNTTRIEGQLVRLKNSMEAEVRFDLRGRPQDRYALVAEKGGRTVRLNDAFRIETPVTNRMRYAVSAPPALLINGPGTMEITVTNENNIDHDLVVMTVLIPGDNFFRILSNDFVSAFLLPQDANIDPADLPLAGLPVELHLPNGPSRLMGSITVIAKGVRVGQTLTARLASPRILGQIDAPFPVAVSIQTYSEAEFVELIRDNVAAVSNSILQSADAFTSLDPVLREQYLRALAELKDMDPDAIIDAYSTLGLFGDGPITALAALPVYNPAAFNGLAGKANALAFLHLTAAQALRNPEATCDELKSMFGLGISIATTAAAGGLLLAGAIIASPALFFAGIIGVIGGVVFLTMSFDTLINGRSWGTAENIGGVPSGVLDVVFLGIPFLVKWSCMALAGAYDPNDITGPDGFGDARWVRADATMPYRIRFENDPVLANAPARTVVITLPVDPTIDLRSFRVTGFGFGGREFEVPGSRGHYQTRLDVRDSLGVFVDVNMGLDLATQSAFFSFRSIDPRTGELSIDPFRGFLPVNQTPPEGDGYVTYTVRPRPEAKTGDVIRASASIIFDNNEPIETNEVFNTVDAVPPSSRVAAHNMRRLDDSSVLIRWSSTDDSGGSGLSRFALYAAEVGAGDAETLSATSDDLVFHPVAVSLTDSSFVFTGTPGATYHFFSLAEDAAGNIEPMKSIADAIVGVGIGDGSEGTLPLQFALHSNYPNPFHTTTTIPFDLPDGGEVTINVYNVLGQRVQQVSIGTVSPGRHQHTLDLSTVASGVYFYEVAVHSGRELRHRAIRSVVLVK